MNLNQITLPASNLKVSVDFYLKMGFTQIVDSPHYARFSCPVGDSTFSLSLTEDTPHHGVTIYFETEELDTWIELIKSRGIHIDQMPIKQNYLWTEAIVHDPSGNTIKLYHAGQNRLNPPWRVNITYGA
ncbi:VOC family protein [Marinicella litoralis]|uniref:Glyoxalase/bleomycin resistance protein/dioxygenase superfamily protein n=1 Tax=Marinicella litoralis TaxID=644220 RepID=A0A4R6XKN5_9GAMM|nr:VOC family protein [Marinicella litoralis]TDR18464.1 glyoxalase/bleomycin resistance protein/dioxygenase superfamily protein [Marinicella litoralis]